MLLSWRSLLTNEATWKSCCTACDHCVFHNVLYAEHLKTEEKEYEYTQADGRARSAMLSVLFVLWFNLQRLVRRVHPLYSLPCTRCGLWWAAMESEWEGSTKPQRRRLVFHSILEQGDPSLTYPSSPREKKPRKRQGPTDGGTFEFSSPKYNNGRTDGLVGGAASSAHDSLQTGHVHGALFDTKTRHEW